MAKVGSLTQRSISDLIPYARNARTHSDAQVAQIASSIKEFGFRNPVLIDGENGIIAGHGRIAAAQKLGMGKVPCVDCSDMSETQKRAYILADNRIALNADWDAEMLGIEVRDLSELNFDLELLGFHETELDEMLGGAPDFQPVGEDEQGRLDQKSPVICPKCGHEFAPS